MPLGDKAKAALPLRAATLKQQAMITRKSGKAASGKLVWNQHNSLISHPHLKTLTKNNPIENKSHAEQVQSKNSIHKIPRVKFTCITATPPPERGTSYCTCNREQTRCLATDACNRLENGTVIVIGYMSCPGHDQHDLAEMGWIHKLVLHVRVEEKKGHLRFSENQRTSWWYHFKQSVSTDNLT